MAITTTTIATTTAGAICLHRRPRLHHLRLLRPRRRRGTGIDDGIQRLATTSPVATVAKIAVRGHALTPIFWYNISHMETKLTIDTSRVDPEGEELEGEVDCVDLDEPFVKPFGGVRYVLHVQVFGSELLVRGRLEQDFDLVCSRCGKDFDDTIKVEDFTASFEISEDSPEVDLTEELRESIILALPTYPVCDETCPGVEQTVEMPSDDRWNVLDNLNKQGERENGKS